MAFITTSVLALHGSTERHTGDRMLNRLRHRMNVRREARGQLRADRYVAHMPTAVLGAC
ncbi:hypothetical protein [Mycolicibacter minnesotensis]